MSASQQPETVQPRPSIPWVVHAGAAIVPAFAVLVAVLVGLTSAISFREVEALSVGAAFGGLMVGQGIGLGGSILFGPRFFFTAGFVPFGIVVPAAFLLNRIGFTSAWLRVKGAQLLPAASGAVAAFVVALLLTRPSGLDLRTFEFSVGIESAFRPGWALVAGAAPWLLAVLLANHAPSAAIMRGILALQAVLVVGSTLFVGYVALDEGLPAAAVIGGSIGFAFAILAMSANLIVMVLVVPLGGGIGLRVGEFRESAGIVTALQENSSDPYLWTVIVISVAAVIALGWLDGPSSDLSMALVRIRSTLIGATAVILPMLVLGRFYGNLGGQIGLLGDFIGGRTGGDLDASVGSSGQPLRWLLILVSMAVLMLLTHVVVARQAGLSWASNESLNARSQQIVRTTSGTLRGAAEQARLAAEQARLAAEAAASSAGAAAAPTAPPTISDVPAAPPSAAQMQDDTPSARPDERAEDDPQRS